MVDVPLGRTGEITNLVSRRLPGATYGGMEPHIPAFP